MSGVDKREANKAIIHRTVDEFWNGGQMSVLDKLYVEDLANHDPTMPQLQGRSGMGEMHTIFHTALPDMRVQIEELIAEGDLVAKRWTVRGTQNGEMAGVPPTGKPVTMTGTTIYRIVDGQIRECWWNYDMLGTLQQVGALPAPEPVGA